LGYPTYVVLRSKQFRNGEGKVLTSTLPFVRQFAFLLPLILLITCVSASAQELPKKIRGYKVHTVKASQAPSTKSSDSNIPAPEIDLSGLEVVDYSLSGVTFKTPVKFGAVNGSGTVDFISFHDFQVNGVPVDVEEYRDKFTFASGQPIVLPKPVSIFVRTDRVLSVGWKEARDSQPQWQVTGRAFVFGKFRKFGFKFKRVIPVDVTFTVKNPLYKPENAAQ
jgi:hypothetical protein